MNKVEYGANGEEQKQAEVFRIRPNYTLPVRIGNWYEDLALLEEKRLQITYKRNNGTLLAQQTRSMFKNTLKSTELVKEGPRVLYGVNYQLKIDLEIGLYLAGILDELQVQVSSNFIDGCLLTASPEKTPRVRNTFRFMGCKAQEERSPVYYGEDVYICNGPLYVQCENATFDDFGDPLKVTLTDSPNFYSRFKIFHWDPQWRDDTTGGDIVPNQRVVIVHSATGQNLAAEYRRRIPTFFGPEVMVTCKNLKDTHKMETEENLWQIVSDKNVDINAFFRAAKGEHVDLSK